MNLPPILKQQPFWTAIVGFVILLISSVVPALEPHLNVIAPSVIIMIGLVIGGFAVETMAAASVARAQAYAAARVQYAEGAAGQPVAEVRTTYTYPTQG